MDRSCLVRKANVPDGSSSLLLGSGFPFKSLQTSASALMAMPTKKKRKMDPMVLRAREERKMKRLTKALKKMEKKPRIPKPLSELEPAGSGQQRPKDAPDSAEVSAEDVERRQVMAKEWSRFAGRRHAHEIRQLDKVLASRFHALEELRMVDKALYADAVRADAVASDLLDVAFEGPAKSRPLASGGFSVPKSGTNLSLPDKSTTAGTTGEAGYLVDGYREEVTKRYAIQYADMKEFLNKLLAASARRRRKKKAEDEED